MDAMTGPIADIIGGKTPVIMVGDQHNTTELIINYFIPQATGITIKQVAITITQDIVITPIGKRGRNVRGNHNNTPRRNS